jgi:type II secretory pathway component GspD/PulD (secretin)
MRLKVAGFSMALVFASAAFGQTPVTRTYSFTHVKTVQEFQEIATTMRVIADMKGADTDNASLTATMSGTEAQIGVTDWLFKQFDQPPQGQDPVTYSVSTDDVVRVFYLPATWSVQEFQELNNSIRTLLEIRLAFGENAQHAFTIRAPAAVVALATKLVDDLTQASHSAGIHEYQLAPGDITQVYYLTHTTSVQDFQEIANGIRTIAEIRRITALNGPKAIIARATPDQIAMATWLVNELDQAHTAPASHSYSGPGPDETIRVFYFPATLTPQDFQAIATKIRAGAQIRRAIALSTPRAFTVRGTSSQVAQADQMVQELNPPAR